MLHYFPPHARCYYDASVSLGLDAKEFDGRLAAIESKVQSSSKAMSKSFGGVSLPGLGGALGGFLSLSAIAAAGKAVIDYGARVQDLSDRFGVSTDAIQHFGNAAEKNGSSLEGMTMGFNKLEISRSKALKGNKELIEAFLNLGISIGDLQKLKPEDLMTKIGASSMDAADMVKLLGKSALELRPTLAGIADGTIQVGDAISGIDIKRLKEAQDEWKKIFETLTILGGETLGKTISAFKTVGDAAADAAKKTKTSWMDFVPILDVIHDAMKFHGTTGEGKAGAGIEGAMGNVGVQVAGAKKSKEHSKAELEKGLDDLEEKSHGDKGVDALQKKSDALAKAPPAKLTKPEDTTNKHGDFSEEPETTAPGSAHSKEPETTAAPGPNATLSQIASFGIHEPAESAEWNKRNKLMDETGSGFGDYGSGSKTDPSRYDAGFAGMPNLGAGVAGIKGGGKDKGIDEGKLFGKMEEMPKKFAAEMKNH